MTGDELFRLAEQARKEAISTAMRDELIWRNQIAVVLIGMLRLLCVCLAGNILLAAVGMPFELSFPFAMMCTTALGIINPSNIFHRSLFHEIGDDAFNAVVEKHAPEA